MKVLGHHDEPVDPSARVARRAQHRGVGGAGTLAHVLGEAPAPGEQCCVPDALHRARDETRGGSFGIGRARHAIDGSGG